MNANIKYLYLTLGKSVQREVVIPKKPSYLTEDVVIPSPPQVGLIVVEDSVL